MIFYLSCTGNTLWAARELGLATGERLIDMADKANLETEYELKAYERLGFCFPVHGWRPPNIVRDFIGKLKIRVSESTFCYALCTAGDNIGETIDFFKKDLSAHGISLCSAWSLLMPESYVGLPFMDVDTAEKEKLKKDRATELLDVYKQDVINHRCGCFNLHKGRWPRINSRIIGWYFNNHMITDKPFRVTADKCLKCGKCAKACPVDNIVYDKNNLPTWRNNGSCLACFNCYHHCPTHAIEYGGRTKKKGQYYFEKSEK